MELTEVKYPMLYSEIIEAKLTPNTVAKAIGVTAHTMYRKLRGRTAWTLWEAMAIKQAIGYPGTLEELFVEG